MSAFKGWKKISSAKDHSILRNDAGHELKIAHAGLSPKMRGHLAEIPIQSAKGAVKLSSGGEAYSQQDKADFSKGMSEAGTIGGASAPAPTGVRKLSQSQATVSSGTEDSTATAISNTQSSNTADPSKADALAKTNAARQKFLGLANGGMVPKRYDDGGEVSSQMPVPQVDPTDIVPGVPAQASDPKQMAFEQRKAEIAKSMGDTARPSQMNMPPEMQSDPSIDNAATTKALDQMDSEKAAGVQAATSTAANQAAVYQQAVDTNKRLVAQGLAPQPLPPAPAGGPTNGEPSAPTGQQSGLMSSQGAPQGSSDPYGIQAGTDMYKSGFNQQLAGIGAEAKATGALGAAEAGIQAQSATNQQKLMNDFQTHMADFQSQSDEAVKALQDPKSGIDPNHYMGSMDTGQRISTAVGLILGGIGGGVLGTENPALKMLNMNIDRDIDAQRQNLGTKKSLLEYNLSKTRNLQEATVMTKGMMNDIAQHNLLAAAAASQDPLAKSRAQQAAGQLKQQASNQFRQLAMQKTMMGGLASGQMSPEMAVEYSPMLDPKQRDVARKELKDMQDANSLRDNTLSAFDHIAKLNTVSNRLGSPIQSNRQIDAIQGPVLDQLTKDVSGRVTPETVSLVKNAFSRMGNNAETNAVARHTIDNLLSQKMNYPTLHIMGITPDKYSRYGKGGQSNIPVGAPAPNNSSK